jgi:UDP-N-acetyl-D-mannosaminuronic acid transferase (WecB/TagA/CpsF family)
LFDPLPVKYKYGFIYSILMIDLGKKNVLGILVNAINYEGAVDKIMTAARQRRPFTVSALAVHGVMTGSARSGAQIPDQSFDLITPDGQPVRWALNLLHGTGLTDRVYGPELTLRVCARAAKENLSIYLYGSKPAVLEKLERNLKLRFPGLTIAGSQPSRFKRLNQAEKEEVVSQIKASGASIVLVGLGLSPSGGLGILSTVKLWGCP